MVHGLEVHVDRKPSGRGDEKAVLEARELVRSERAREVRHQHLREEVG